MTRRRRRGSKQVANFVRVAGCVILGHPPSCDSLFPLHFLSRVTTRIPTKPIKFRRFPPRFDAPSNVGYTRHHQYDCEPNRPRDRSQLSQPAARKPVTELSLSWSLVHSRQHSLFRISIVYRHKILNSKTFTNRTRL